MEIFLLLLGALISLETTTGFLQPRPYIAREKIAWTTATHFSAVTTPSSENSKEGSQLSAEGSEIRESKENRNPHVSGQTYNVSTVADLDSYWEDKERRFRNDDGEINYDSLLRALSVKGDTQIIGSADHPDYMHPVAKLLHERRRTQSSVTEGMRPDGCKTALVIEGGGMRGCVSAGAVCALGHLGLRDTFDVVYGSSAGSIIGAYFITGQLPWFGPELYYDKLTTAGRKFIDSRRLLRALGFGLVDPRLLKDVLTRPQNGKPVLNLPYLKQIIEETKPLNWEAFVERQKVQPLKVVAAGLKSEKSVVMGLGNGGFTFGSLDELTSAMHASSLLPGIAGPLMNVNTEALSKEGKQKFVLGNNFQDQAYEPLADALIYEPLPYRTAVKEGATHVVVIRSRPDGTDTTGKGGVFERLIMRRFFLRKNKLPNIFKRLSKQLHKKLYAEDIITLNDAALNDRDYKDTSSPHLLTVALPPGSPEVTRLETGREAIFEGVRRGFARTYDALVENPAERGRGAIVAKEYFPDEILDYDPLDIHTTDESAFAFYLRQSGRSPEAVAGNVSTHSSR
jgi:predicted acylesterase/phospholipase RssA